MKKQPHYKHPSFIKMKSFFRKMTERMISGNTDKSAQSKIQTELDGLSQKALLEMMTYIDERIDKKINETL